MRCRPAGLAQATKSRRGSSAVRGWAASEAERMGSTWSGTYSCIVNTRARESARPAASDVQRLPQRPQGGFLDCLALGRASMDRMADILEPRAHFDGLAESGGEFRYAPPHGLPAQADAAVAPRHGPHATVGRFPPHPPAVSPQRE